MHRIDSDTAQADKFGPGKPGYTEGDPLLGVAPTATTAAAFDAFQEELLAPIEWLGITPSKADNRQLLRALRLIAWKMAGHQSLATWTTHASSPVAAADINAGCRVGDAGVHLVGNGGLVLFASPTGSSVWVGDNSDTRDLLAVTNLIGEGAVLSAAVGKAGAILACSSSGATVMPSPVATDLRAVCTGMVGGLARMVAVGDGGTILSGASPGVFASRPSGVSTDLYGVTWRSNRHDGGTGADGVFVAVGAGGTLLRSVDGLTWTVGAAPSASDLLAVSASFQFVVTDGSSVWCSVDGATWQSAAGLPFGVFSSMSSDPDGGPTVVVLGGQLQVSLDPVVTPWRQVSTGSPGVRCCAPGPSCWLAGGAAGLVRVSAAFVR